MIKILVSEAILDIRDKVNDKDMVEYTDSELLTNINEAVQYIGTYLVGVKSPLAVNEMVINDESFIIPNNYTLPAGQYPIKVTGNIGKLLDEPPLKFRYFSTCKKLDFDDELPYNHEGIWQIMIKLASIYALNRNEFNIQQDKALLDEINQQLANITNQ